MLWLIALVTGAAGALLQYGWRGGRPTLARALATPVPLALRALAFALLLGLLFNAPVGVRSPRPAWVALDASLSMERGEGPDEMAWRGAVDSARAAAGGRGDTLFLFGDSLRGEAPPEHPTDTRSDVDPVVQRALATGRPVVLVTDGELSNADELRRLPAGSRVVVIPHAAVRDVAALDLRTPRAIVSGDTVTVRVTIRAGAGGAGPGTVQLRLGDRALGTVTFDSLRPFAEQEVPVRTAIAGPEGPAELRAVVSAAGDAEPRNDTLGVGVDLSRQPGAVFVSTSPDYDARYALAVLRGALALPTRAYYHLSPGNWRVDGSYARATEAEVRAAFRDAPVAILHGDTAVFGAPRQATRAPLALMVPTTGDGNEWYADAAPASPLSGALAGFVWDSLPPLLVGAGPEPHGDWRGLQARRGREALTRTIVAGDDASRRVVIVAASDLWRWAFRGGASADAFTALWGSIFDYLAAHRADRRAAVPDAGVFRAGDPIRWRRGAAGDSTASVVLVSDNAERADTLQLRFVSGAATVQTPPRAAGRYLARTAGGSAALVVNAAAELIPQATTAVRGAVGGRAPLAPAPRAREAAWLYLLLLVALCGEWIVRRRAGMR